MMMTKEEAFSNLLNDPIYAILGEALSCGRDNVTVAREIVKAGVKTIQYREKHKKWREKYVEGKEIAHICNESGATFIMNDSVDLAIACGAHGIHVGQDDAPAPFVRKLVGPEIIIGVSTNTIDEIKGAMADGADYIGFGPVFPTESKKDANEVVSQAAIDFALHQCTLPVVSIGGISLSNIKGLYNEGYRSFAMISAIVSQPDITLAINTLRAKLKE